ncbi:MetQ/NlpA family ABC transporter substrate-binding protein [Helicobacter mesocricetorum]|uniref:MetQ/NlpA family ABC transporter substrate-binding protein n=1 Tax=Helicobacter mesocricetorum TaxID=87012 RepID=UPI000CF18EA5
MFKAIIGIFGIIIALVLGGCGDDTKMASNVAEEKTILVVGATPEPHATILEQIIPLLQEEGVSLEIKEFTDYVTPNLSLQDGSLDANFFQHKPYLDEFNKEKGITLVSVAGVHLEPMGVYSNKIKNLEELRNNDLISIPNDPSNGARALRILEKEGIIALKKDVKLASVQDIVENPKNLNFKEIDAPQLTRTLDDVSVSVINTNFALLAGLNPLNDAIAIEDKDSPYVNILVVKEGRENDENIKKLIGALQSARVKDFILQKYKGSILPSF